jgi:hypothetical protein
MGNFQYQNEPVDEMEDVLGVFYGGRGQVGQQLVVTNRRLLMGPLDVRMALDIDAYVLDHAAAGVGGFVKDVLSHYGPMNPTTLWLRHVVDVQPTNNASLFKPPGLRITTDTDQIFNVGIVASPKTMNLSKKNNGVRDRAVVLIRLAVQAAKAAPASPIS